MEILAAVGSADFLDDAIAGQVDGTRAKRSPGSTLKPFVYGLALDRGLIHPMTLLEDAPTRFAAFTPENFDGGFMGPVFARDALVHSRNVPAAELLARVGYRDFHEFLARAGVTELEPPEYYGLALALGGTEVTMHELVGLYAMLANGGKLRPLKALSADAADPAPPRLLSREASFLVLDMLRGNPRPGGTLIAGADARPPAAWKTGTSYAFRDAWTVGVYGPYVLAVWVGNFDGSSNPAFIGRQAAAPLFFEILDALTATTSELERVTGPAPDLNLRKVSVCASTGDLPGRYCPRTIESWFIPGVSPITVSDVHRAVRIENATGERACRFDPQTTHEEVFEFWPSDIQQQFTKAGIGVRSPPAWAADCPLDVRATTGREPEITSPTVGLSYHVRTDRADTERLPLAATTDADVRWLFWFVNDSFVARVPRDEAFLWRPEVGDFDIRAVDDLGRSSFRRLSVRVAQ
jgi:penicillin-binding protein 1C